MKLLTISNLYPRPDRPVRGLFNAQLFAAFEGEGSGGVSSAGPVRGPGERGSVGRAANICLVPEWRVWRWPRIAAWRDPVRQPFHTAYCPVFYVPRLGRSWSASTYLLSMRRLKPAVEGRDAVLTAWLYPDGVAATRLAVRYGKPSWIMVQGSDTFHLLHRGRCRSILAACGQAAGLVCVCRSLADRLLDAGATREKLHVVPNGVDTSLFRYRPREEARVSLRARPVAFMRENPPAQHTQGPAPRIAIFIGNLAPVKGPDILLEAWAELRKTAAASPARTLIVIGEGPLRPTLDRLSRRLGIDDSVVFLGARPHEEIALWMNAADCLCLSSHNEGMPNVLLEALASRLPAVATRVGACEDLLRGHAAGRLVPPGDPAALAHALDDLLSMEVDRSKLPVPRGVRGWREQAAEILALVSGQPTPPAIIRP